MDWGIVVSVLVANTVFILAAAVIGASLFTLAARRMKKEFEAGVIPKCPIPGFEFNDAIEVATSET
jgi:hypothetical protein